MSNQFDLEGRIAVVTGFGNRLDEHYRALGRAAAASYDRVVICEVEEFRRGRPPGEIAAFLAEGLAQGGMAGACIDTVVGLEDAVARAAGMVTSGGLLHVACQHPDPATLVAQAFARGRSPAPALP